MRFGSNCSDVRALRQQLQRRACALAAASATCVRFGSNFVDMRFGGNFSDMCFSGNSTMRCFGSKYATATCAFHLHFSHMRHAQRQQRQRCVLPLQQFSLFSLFSLSLFSVWFCLFSLSLLHHLLRVPVFSFLFSSCTSRFFSIFFICIGRPRPRLLNSVCLLVSLYKFLYTLLNIYMINCCCVYGE